MDNIKNAYISVEIEDSSIIKLTNDIMKVLKDLGVEGTVFDRFHVSIAYVIGIHSKELIEQIVTDIAEGSFEIKAKGFSIVKSDYFKKDLIFLELQPTHDFGYAVDYVAENCEIKKWDGGFIAHITLIGLEYLSEKNREDLSRYLEIMNLDVLSSMKINGKTISVFDENRELIIKKYFND